MQKKAEKDFVLFFLRVLWFLYRKEMLKLCSIENKEMQWLCFIKCKKCAMEKKRVAVCVSPKPVMGPAHRSIHPWDTGSLGAGQNHGICPVTVKSRAVPLKRTDAGLLQTYALKLRGTCEELTKWMGSVDLCWAADSEWTRFFLRWVRSNTFAVNEIVSQQYTFDRFFFFPHFRWSKASLTVSHSTCRCFMYIYSWIKFCFLCEYYVNVHCFLCFLLSGHSFKIFNIHSFLSVKIKVNNN